MDRSIRSAGIGSPESIDRFAISPAVESGINLSDLIELLHGKGVITQEDIDALKRGKSEKNESSNIQ